MAFCIKCGSEFPAETPLCPNCGEQMDAVAPDYFDEWDHTADFTPEDISEGKLLAMMSYLTGILGIVMTYLGAKDSPFAMFHAREALKINICIILVAIFTSLLFWTCIVPFAGAIAEIILWVLCIIGFFNVCNGKAVEIPILRGMKWLK